tara:strand:+ start:1008 stop:1214 length:207 start_codon:yes stop_codon:yes gene_type:complete
MIKEWRSALTRRRLSTCQFGKLPLPNQKPELPKIEFSSLEIPNLPKEESPIFGFVWLKWQARYLRIQT